MGSATLSFTMFLKLSLSFKAKKIKYDTKRKVCVIFLLEKYFILARYALVRKYTYVEFGVR